MVQLLEAFNNLNTWRDLNCQIGVSNFRTHRGEPLDQRSFGSLEFSVNCSLLTK